MPRTSATLEPLYTKPETAELFNVPLRFVERITYDHWIRFVRVGRISVSWKAPSPSSSSTQPITRDEMAGTTLRRVVLLESWERLTETRRPEFWPILVRAEL